MCVSFTVLFKRRTRRFRMHNNYTNQILVVWVGEQLRGFVSDTGIVVVGIQVTPTVVPASCFAFF